MSTYIEHVCTYLYLYSKIVTNILMGFKIWCQVGGRRQFFFYGRMVGMDGRNIKSIHQIFDLKVRF